jgi:hypothetical protein
VRLALLTLFLATCSLWFPSRALLPANFLPHCGVPYFIEILPIRQPVYWLAAAAKILTAVSSLGTAVVLAAAAEDIIRRLIDLCPLSMK